MKPRYVVDTNVLIAASAADPTNPKDIDATPREPAQRLIIWQWLDEFSSSASHLVLDFGKEIYSEYCRKLGFNDYGIQVVMRKWDTCSVDSVEVQPHADWYEVIPHELKPVLHDVADRKMVAAALAAMTSHGECPIAFAGDTDWHGWEIALTAHGVCLTPIIEAWSRAKYAAKLAR